MGGFQHRPKALICKACGGQYFAASLPIHQKTCFQRNPFVDVECSTCRCFVKSGRYHNHIVDCTGPPAIQATCSSQFRPLRASKPEASADQLNAPEADGRVRCRNCDRGFHHERIAKHQSVCAGTRRVVRGERSKSDVDSRSARSEVFEKRGDTCRPHTQAASAESLKRRRSFGRVVTEMPRASGLNAVRVKLGQYSIVSKARDSSVSQSVSSQGRGSDKRYDLVHRDFNRSSGLSQGGFGGSASKLSNLSTSTATSAANPLATTTLMTVHRMW